MFLIKFRLEMFMFLLEREGQGAWVREGKENKEGGKGVRRAVNDPDVTLTWTWNGKFEP